MCLLSTLALALGCLAGAALAVAFTELAIVVAGFVAGGFVGYLIFAAFLEVSWWSSDAFLTRLNPQLWLCLKLWLCPS